jgi:hypothetical protein
MVCDRQHVSASAGIFPKVSCPIHKKNFSLQDGSCISGEAYSIRTYPVKVEDGSVFLLLPPSEELARVTAIEQRKCGASCVTCSPA